MHSLFLNDLYLYVKTFRKIGCEICRIESYAFMQYLMYMHKVGLGVRKFRGVFFPLCVSCRSIYKIKFEENSMALPQSERRKMRIDSLIKYVKDESDSENPIERQELIKKAMADFNVSKRTARDYIDTVCLRNFITTVVDQGKQKVFYDE